MKKYNLILTLIGSAACTVNVLVAPPPIHRRADEDRVGERRRLLEKAQPDDVERGLLGGGLEEAQWDVGDEFSLQEYIKQKLALLNQKNGELQKKHRNANREERLFCFAGGCAGIALGVFFGWVAEGSYHCQG